MRSTPFQVLDNSTEIGHVSVSSTTRANDFPKTGCSSSIAASSAALVSSTTQPDIMVGVDGGNFAPLVQQDHNGGSSEETANVASSTNLTQANRKPPTKPETTKHCCTTVALPTQSRTMKHLKESTVMTILITSITTEFLSHTTRSESGTVETSAVNLSVKHTHLEDYTSADNNNNNNNNNSLWSTVSPIYESVTTATQTQNVAADSAELVSRNRTFNFVFDGNCLALKRRGPEAERRFRSVVLDALSSGLSVSTDRLLAGDLRCGSLNLSVTLIDASDDDVRWVMSTMAAATLRVSVENVDEPFVLSRVELMPPQDIKDSAATRAILDRVVTTGRLDIEHGSVAILVVFIIIGALAVLAGTVSAAVYVYFKRIYSRTFVVNRRALRWSSRASDTVKVINIDEDDASSGGRASSRAAPTNDAVEWSPPISGSGFGDDRSPIAFANWSPHYCQARFRRLIAPLPSTLTSLPELLNDDEATVDVISDGSFHHRRESCIINLLEPLPAVQELHVGSTNIDDTFEDADCHRGTTKLDTGFPGGITFGWTAENLTTSSNRATPF